MTNPDQDLIFQAVYDFAKMQALEMDRMCLRSIIRGCGVSIRYDDAGGCTITVDPEVPFMEIHEHGHYTLPPLDDFKGRPQVVN